MTAYVITIQLIERIKVLHSLGFVHNDLKLENILTGSNDPSKIFLIDFGLSQSYLNENGGHVAKQNLNKFTGNFMFASLNSCRGNTKSRGDDIQSCILIMIYLLNKNELPWSNFNSKFRDLDNSLSDFLGERLQLSYTKELFKLVPKTFRATLKEILVLTFDQIPNYEHYIDKIKFEMMKEVKMGHELSYKSALVFEWNHYQAHVIKQNNQKQEVHQEGDENASISSDSQSSSDKSTNKIYNQYQQCKSIVINNHQISDNQLSLKFLSNQHSKSNFVSPGEKSSHRDSDFDCNSQNPFFAAIKNMSDNNLGGSQEIGSFPNSPMHTVKSIIIGSTGSNQGLSSSQGNSSDLVQPKRGPPKKSFFGQQESKVPRQKKSLFAKQMEQHEEEKVGTSGLDVLQNNSKKKLSSNTVNNRQTILQQPRQLSELAANYNQSSRNIKSQFILPKHNSSSNLKRNSNENFESDETDELWGLQKNMNNCFSLEPHKNDIKSINNNMS